MSRKFNKFLSQSFLVTSFPNDQKNPFREIFPNFWRSEIDLEFLSATKFLELTKSETGKYPLPIALILSIAPFSI